MTSSATKKAVKAAPCDEAFMLETKRGKLAAFYHPPKTKRQGRPVGCLILVGGPQYRVGAHRQYIHLARALSNAGIGAMRFDYLGMGDSDGALSTVDERRDDIAAAAQALLCRLGKDAQIFPWGLCEGASAIFMHHTHIPNFAGAIIANPWVGDAQIEAEVRWRHYYLGRLKSGRLLERLRSGKVSGSDLVDNLKGFFGGIQPEADQSYTAALETLPMAFADLLSRNRPVLYLASSNDRERETFDFAVKSKQAWRPVKNSVFLMREDIPGADHTFSSKWAKDTVARKTLDFLNMQTLPLRAMA